MTPHSMSAGTAKLRELAGQGLELPAFWQAAGRVLERALPLYSTPCWWTLDPRSLLATSHFQTDIAELPADMLAHEYLEDDFHKLADIARSASGISTIHEATDGNPARSAGWRKYVQAYGGDQEVLLAMRTRNGDTWGVAGFYRAEKQPWFSQEELQFLCEVAPILGEGARRGLLVGEAWHPDSPRGPGVVTMTRDFSVESVSSGAECWLSALPDSRWESTGELPPAVVAVASQEFGRMSNGLTDRASTVARVRTRDGVWLILHGAAMKRDGEPCVAVIIEPVEPVRIATLLMSAYGFTAREQELTRLIFQGHDTMEIAFRLGVTPPTVQQHLKSIFEKTGVRSRRELTGQVFFGHYEPRLRDNEVRAQAGLGIRGAPRSHALVP